jgi:hypothetical protein
MLFLFPVCSIVPVLEAPRPERQSKQAVVKKILTNIRVTCQIWGRPRVPIYSSFTCQTQDRGPTPHIFVGDVTLVNVAPIYSSASHHRRIYFKFVGTDKYVGLRSLANSSVNQQIYGQFKPMNEPTFV